MDARKLKEKATEAFTKGKFSKAAEAYAEYCAADPKDLQARLRMGDAWSKAGQKEKAIGAYQLAAEGFAKEGFLPRAIAASKLILELDPSHKGVQKMLAELYARKSGPMPKPTTVPGLKIDGVKPPEPAPAAAPAPPPPPAPVPVAAPPPAPAPAPVAAKAEEIIPIEVEPEGAGDTEVALELDVSVTGGGVPPLPPPPPPLPKEEVAVGVELEVEPASPPRHEPKRTSSGAFELDLGASDEPLEPLEAPKRTSSGAFELSLDDAEAEPVPLDKPKPPEPRAPTASGAYELDLDDAPAEAPIELTEPKPKLEDEALVAELSASPELPPLPPPPPDPPPAAPEDRPSAPPGLRPKKAEAPAPPAAIAPPPPAESAPRFWMPGASDTAAQPARAAGPARGVTVKTDLERSLEAFSRFDDEVQIIENPEPSAPRPPAASSHHTFTELELEGDSLLHAVETAAAVGLEQRGQEVPAAVVEEAMEAPDEIKVEPGALPKIPLFSDLPEDAFIALFERCPLRRFEPTDAVIQQGSLGDSFFVICAGAVKVFRIDGEVRRDIATLQEGAFFGEMALLSGAARTASVEAAAEDTQLLEISAPILTELSLKYPPVASALKKFCRQRLLTNVMSSSALFAPFSRSDRRTLVERFRARDVQKGDVLIKQGERSDGMYIVLSGEVEVRVGASPVAALKEGDIFGEMSLLTKAPATATCAAARRTSLLRLPREAFDQIVLSHPQILVLVSDLTDERKKQNAALASRAPKSGAEATPMV